MDDILAKKNRHLFLEEKDNQNNSFIGNINDVANRKTELDTVAAHITNVDAVGSHINNVDTVANNISDINDAVDNIATVKTFNDNVNNGTMQYLLEAFTTSLNEQGNAWEVRLTQLGESILATTSAFNYSTVVTVSSDIPANGTLILPNSMKYKVGTHMLMVSWNGTVCYAGEQYDEVGAYGVWATSIKLKQPAKAGDKIQLRIVALTDQSSYVDITEAAINASQFTASGSNTERYLPEFLGDVVNVKNFGAVGNGVNDDTTAFQSAIASGKAVFVPEGTYKLTTNITGNFCSTGNSTFTGGTINGSTILRGTAQKNNDIINVKDFGAKGDGLTDDTGAINNALLRAAGKTLYFPAGVYLTSTGVGIPSNTKVKGDGEWETVVKLTDTAGWTKNCLYNEKNTWDHTSTWDSSVNTGNENIIVEDICVDGNGRRSGSGTSENSGCAIQFCYVKNLYIKNVRAINGRLHCVDIACAQYDRPEGATVDEIYYGASSDVTLENVTAYDSYKDDAITTHYSKRIRIINPLVYRTRALEFASTNGIEIDDGSYDVQIYGGLSRDHDCGLQIKGHSGALAPARNVSVFGTICEGNSCNFSLFTGTGVFDNAHFVNLYGCVSKNLKYYEDTNTERCDIRVNGYKNVNIEDFFVVVEDESLSYERTDSSILVASNADNIKFNGLHVKGINQGGSACLQITSNAKRVEINNITFEDCHNGPAIAVKTYEEVSISNLSAKRELASGETSYPLIVVANAVVDFNNSTLKRFSVQKIISFDGYNGILNTSTAQEFYLGQDVSTEKTFTNQPVALWKKADSARSVFNGPVVLQRLGWVGGAQNLVTSEGVLLAFSAQAHYNTSQYDGAVVGSYKSSDGDNSQNTDLVFGTRQNGDSGTGATIKWRIKDGGDFLPFSDNVYNIGNGSFRAKTVYAGTGSINTSDRRLKNSIADPNTTLLEAWGNVEYKVFKFNDALNKKGDKARIHVGVVAQQVAEAFSQKGLDAGKFGLFCFDSWDDKWIEREIVDEEAVYNEEGVEVKPAVTHIEREKIEEAGDRYSIRYDEALALECAYQRWLGKQRDAKIKALMQRISALENNH